MKKIKLSILRNCIVVSLLFLTYNCESNIDEDVVTELEIVNSEELEELIIAAYDMRHAAEELCKELNENEKGKEILSMMNSNSSNVLKIPFKTKLDDKVRIFNERKRVLIRRNPNFQRASSERRMKQINDCLRNSIRVNKEMLRMGISPFHTRSNDSSRKNGSADFSGWRRMNNQE